MSDITNNLKCDETDLAIIRETWSGLPLCKEPYQQIAKTLGLGNNEVLQRLQHMLVTGIIRRISVVPNHHALGYTVNCMAVWDIPDDYIDKAGMIIGKLDFVSYCYQRPRKLPDWRYNLFVTIYGKDRKSTEKKINLITELLGEYSRESTVLYCKRILKKTGLRG
ncbi:MAG: hypothetical protein MI673_04395 [Thiotrichales bacterium]|nr:hypothetical protein [Thiotrichales bacterium]